MPDDEHSPDAPVAAAGTRWDFERWAEELRSERQSRGPRTSSSDGLVFDMRVVTRGSYLVTSEVRVEPGLVRHTAVPSAPARPYDLAAAMQRSGGQRPRWIADDDFVLWFRLENALRAHGEPLHRQALQADAEGAALFHDFVATGRARFDRTPLSWSGPRPGWLAWRVHDDGTQSLAIEVDGFDDDEAIVLPLSPPHFVSQGECGPIEIDVPPALLPRLLAAPRVAPRDARKPPKALRDAIERHGLPALLELRLERHAIVEPVPRLAITLHPEHPRAVLSFVYDGIEVTAVPHTMTPSRLIGTTLHKIHRDRGAEMRAFETLRDLGGSFTREDEERLLLLMPSPADWIRLWQEHVPGLRERGWEIAVLEGDAWDVVEPEAGDWYVDVYDDEGTEGGDWFMLELGVEVDGERVNILPAVLEALAQGRIGPAAATPAAASIPLRLGHRTILVPTARLQKILDVLVELYGESLHDERLRVPTLDAARLLLLEDFSWRGGDRLRRFAERLAALREPPTAEPPAGLCATMRPYQRQGLGWLRALSEAGLGGILADDMGLGKTLQALAHLLHEHAAGEVQAPSLVVAPRSVLRNWAREAERFTPGLRVEIYHGPSRELLLDDPPDVIVTTYALLQRDEVLRERSWHVVVLDEAQAIKNATTKVAAAARKLRARQRIILTGTPMENNLGELWSLVHFVAPGLLGDPRAFSRLYRNPIEREGDTGRLVNLSRRIAPFMLRRTKAAVLSELPPKTEVVRHAVLTGRQRDLYESVRLTMEKKVRAELRRRGLARSKIVVLDALLKLRQVCCDPHLVPTESAAAVHTSAKLELLLELLDELRAEGRSVLIFSQFTSMLALIAEKLHARDIEYLQITGKSRKRQEIVDRFQAGEVGVMLVSLKAGGTGLNLTAADTVIHYDPWWNPAVEQQASDRTHRIGQTRPVTVYRLVCEGTVEERMLVLHERKRALTRALEEGAERRSEAGFQLDEDDLAALLAPAG